MGYRNDDVAAAQRAAALEREVAELRARLAEVDLSSLRDDIATRREDLDDLRRTLAGIRRSLLLSPGVILALLVIFFVVSLVLMVLGFSPRWSCR